MTKLEKMTAVLLCGLLALCTAFAFAGYNSDGDTNEKKYDAAIQVKCNDAEVYEFPVG